ncbi:hypothetical protein CLV92_11179 [Kineococcus xinjiangensis]|uniref:DUF8175 domain-containing protein n=1 Tax=Kineococcus xinjiangensis TaxID=512762 RepID=A0A2S6IG23_9ACTN|nr:hypothetical protein [Kineococcus xinjiangensis]PPK93162.1 hypothetical protein CLV92_11179 [Kineococcus xinjiangensis]
MDGQDAVAPDEESPWTSTGFLLAAAVVAALAVTGVVIMVMGSWRADAADAAGVPAPVAVETAATSPARNTPGCSLPAGDPVLPHTAPAGSRWVPAGGMTVPEAPRTHGPAVVAPSGFRSCYAASPTGALHAAVGAWAATTGPALQDLAAGAAEGHGRDALQRRLGEGSAPVGPPPLTVVGFTFGECDARACTVDVAFETAAGQPVHALVPLAREREDWRVLLPPDGDLAGTLRRLPDLAGFIPWTGE